MIKEDYTWLKRYLLLGFFFSVFIAFCFFGIDIKNTGLFAFQLIYSLVYVYFSYVFIKNTIKSKISKKRCLIETIFIIIIPILAIIYSIFFVDVKYVDGKYNGASLTHIYILFIFIVIYIIFAVFSIRNTKCFL